MTLFIQKAQGDNSKWDHIYSQCSSQVLSAAMQQWLYKRLDFHGSCVQKKSNINFENHWQLSLKLNLLQTSPLTICPLYAYNIEKKKDPTDEQ